jgi:hypothetical protein
MVPTKLIGCDATAVETTTAPVDSTTGVLNVIPPADALTFTPAIVTGPVFTSSEASVEEAVANRTAFAAALAEFRVTRFSPALSAEAIPSTTMVPAPVTVKVTPEAALILPSSVEERVRVEEVAPSPIPPPEDWVMVMSPEAPMRVPAAPPRIMS